MAPLVAMTCIVSGCKSDDETIKVASVTVNPSSLVLKEGDSAHASATVSPSDATDKTVSWTSSNPSVATVDADGNISAVKEGQATITAKAGDKSGTCEVTVEKEVVAVTAVTLNRTALSLKEGESFKLTATVTPSDATDKTVTWTSSSTAIAAVDANGQISAVKEGQATITAKAGDKSAACKVTVTKNVVPVSSITLNKNALSLTKGASETLTATVNPSDATDKIVSWSSSDAAVANVDQSGKVTALKGGNASITASAGGKAATCAVTVTVPVSSLTLNETSLRLYKGEVTLLRANVSPADATSPGVSWTSSNPSVAAVNSEAAIGQGIVPGDNDGVILAVNKGTATITASADGKTAACSIEVLLPVESVTLAPASITLSAGDKMQLTASVHPGDATLRTPLAWTTTNESVATVDQNGNVTAIKEGTAAITVTADGKAASCQVTVRKKGVGSGENEGFEFEKWN